MTAIVDNTGSQSVRELAIPLSVNRQPTLTEFNYQAPEVKPYPPPIRWVRVHAFKLFLAFAFGGTFISLVIAWFVMDDRDDSLLGLSCSHAWKELFKYLSIPLVAIVFTWWHVWLGIQMCFYPVDFKGCLPPVLGWQGIVPRRAHIMANRSCDIMIGTLITIEEIIDRVDPTEFYLELQSVLAQTSEEVLSKVAMKNWPRIWQSLPQTVKDELQRKVLEESRSMFEPVIQDLKLNINNIINIKDMSVDILVQNKALLVEMFQKIGNREFVFIQHMSAVMGFFCGFLQMILWLIIKSGGNGGHECTGVLDFYSFQCWGGLVILPVSGLIIGYFTNWLGITMIFRPVLPHIICGGYVNIQGVFLKRQKEVSKELAAMIAKHLVHAQKMLEYLVTKPDVMEKILEIYQRHVHESIDSVMGNAKGLIPIFVGPGAVEGLKEQVLQETLAELPNHTAEITAFMDRSFDLQNTLSTRLAGLSPDVFEGMLHPVFQEDEWMILLLGGVLGVCVGTLQAFALGS